MRSLFTLSLLFLSLITYGQDTLVPEWTRIHPSPVPSGNAEAWCVGVAPDGDIYWGVNQDSYGLWEFMNAYTFHISPGNTVIWEDTSVVGSFAQQSYVLYGTDSVVYLAGRTCATAGLDSCDALVFAVDAMGITLWTFEWDGGSGYEEIDGLVPKPDGIYITGWTDTPSDAIDITLMKLDYSGNLIWQNDWGSGLPRDDRQDGHIVVDDSMIYLCGVYDSSPGLAFEGRALLAKFNKLDGSFVDTTLFGRQDAWLNAEDALGMSSDGTYLYLTGYTTSAANDWDLFAAKYDKDLNQIWYTVWGGLVEADVARSIQPAGDGSIYIAGTTRSYGNGEEEAVLIRLDASGNPMWYKTWGAAGDDHVLDFALSGDSVIYISGKTNSYHPQGSWEAFLMKLQTSEIFANLKEFPFLAINVAPNPSNGIFKITTNEPVSIEIVNSLGEKMDIDLQKTGNSYQVNLSNVPSGVYLAVVTHENSVRALRLIKE